MTDSNKKESEDERMAREYPLLYSIGKVIESATKRVQLALFPPKLTDDEKAAVDAIIAGRPLYRPEDQEEIRQIAADFKNGKFSRKRAREDEAPGENEAERKDAADESMGVAPGAQADADASMREIIKVRRKNPQPAPAAAAEPQGPLVLRERTKKPQPRAIVHAPAEYPEGLPDKTPPSKRPKTGK